VAQGPIPDNVLYSLLLEMEVLHVLDLPRMQAATPNLAAKIVSYLNGVSLTLVARIVVVGLHKDLGAYRCKLLEAVHLVDCSLRIVRATLNLVVLRAVNWMNGQVGGNVLKVAGEAPLLGHVQSLVDQVQRHSVVTLAKHGNATHRVALRNALCQNGLSMIAVTKNVGQELKSAHE
jgi:hypothetical protein